MKTIARNLLGASLTFILFLAGASPEMPQQGPPKGPPLWFWGIPPAPPPSKWFPPFQATLSIKVTGPRGSAFERSFTITVGTSRLLIEPSAQGKSGLLFPSDPARERLGIILMDPPVILRWAGDSVPPHFPVETLFRESPPRAPPGLQDRREKLREQKWEKDEVDGKKALRTTFETKFHRVILWLDAETRVPLKIVRKSLRGNFQEDILLTSLKRLPPETADSYIARFLERFQDWEVEEWRAREQVLRILQSQRLPVRAGELQARRVRLYRRGDHCRVRVFYGGRGNPHFFAAELTRGIVPSFIPDSPRPPNFVGKAGNWVARIWTNLPPDDAERHISAFVDTIASSGP
ncbi:MAG: hypothetical protein V2G42_04830 [bacterium JZ-2024 1]